MAPTKVPVTHQLSNETRTHIEEFVVKMNTSFTRGAGKLVRLVCGHPATRAAQAEAPDAALVWQHNLQSLVMDASRMFFYKDNLDIAELTPSDSGVYACALSLGAKENVTLGVFSIQVTAAAPTRYVFEQEPLPLQCHSEALGRLYPDATRHWLLNGTVVHTPGAVPADSPRVDVVPFMTRDLEGDWECHVTHAQTARMWKTAWYRIACQDAPSFLERFYRKMVDNPGVTLGVSCVLIVLLCVCFFFTCLRNNKMEEAAEKKFQDQRSGFEGVLVKNRVGGKVVAKESSDDDEEEEEDDSEDDDTYENNNVVDEEQTYNSVDESDDVVAKESSDDDEEEEDDSEDDDTNEDNNVVDEEQTYNSVDESDDEEKEEDDSEDDDTNEDNNVVDEEQTYNSVDESDDGDERTPLI